MSSELKQTFRVFDFEHTMVLRMNSSTVTQSCVANVDGCATGNPTDSWAFLN